jgi:hypothetical protein
MFKGCHTNPNPHTSKYFRTVSYNHTIARGCFPTTVVYAGSIAKVYDVKMNRRSVLRLNMCSGSKRCTSGHGMFLVLTWTWVRNLLQCQKLGLYCRWYCHGHPSATQQADGLMISSVAQYLEGLLLSKRCITSDNLILRAIWPRCVFEHCCKIASTYFEQGPPVRCKRRWQENNKMYPQKNRKAWSGFIWLRPVINRGMLQTR